MKRITTLLLALGILAAAPTIAVAQLTEEMRRDGWVSIFDGATLEGWRQNDTGNNAGVFRVEDGSIVGTGGRQHLYFMEEFTNFELMLDAKINNDGNSGVFVKSQWQDNAWPTSGFEVQINSSHSDPQRTGSLWSIVRWPNVTHGDDEWFTLHIICRGNDITVRVNDETLYTYTCQRAGRGGGQGAGQGAAPPQITEQNRRISQSGYIALQQHHDGSVVHFRNIFVRRLP